MSLNFSGCGEEIIQENKILSWLGDIGNVNDRNAFRDFFHILSY